MRTQIVSFSLYPKEVEYIDKRVEELRELSFTPNKINRSTVMREMMDLHAKSRKEASL